MVEPFDVLLSISDIPCQSDFWDFASERWAALDFPIEQLDAEASEAADAFIAQCECDPDEWSPIPSGHAAACQFLICWLTCHETS